MQWDTTTTGGRATRFRERAIDDGTIDRWGAIDTTDAGRTDRYALTAAWHEIGAQSSSSIVVYGLHYDLALFSDFTYFLNDPVHGDQIEQHDDRSILGAQATHTLFGTFLGYPSLTTAGFAFRCDDIGNGLYHTEARERLNPVTINSIDETSAAPFVENRTNWTDWLRTVVGLRADVFWFAVHNVVGGNSGNVSGTVFSPKLSIVAGPWDRNRTLLRFRRRLSQQRWARRGIAR